jgi:hypothetical protein
MLQAFFWSQLTFDHLYMVDTSLMNSEISFVNFILSIQLDVWFI